MFKKHSSVGSGTTNMEKKAYAFLDLLVLPSQTGLAQCGKEKTCKLHKNKNWYFSILYREVKDSESEQVNIAFGVLEQIKNELCRFHRPPSLSIRMSVLSLSSSSNATAEAGEGNGLLVGQNIF
nr:hypothetical protein Iba_chr08cCG1960 [Ipomoea batatas]